MKELMVGIGLFMASWLVSAQITQGSTVEQTPSVLSMRDRVAPFNQLVEDRLDNLLPVLMKEAGIDMWLVINREYGEDRVYFSLVPQPTFAARRTTILVFHRKDDGTVERFALSRYAIGSLYPSRWEGGTIEQQWQQLGKIIQQINPEKIGINTSEDWALADGLSAGLYKKLTQVLSPEYQDRLVSAQDLVIRWLETRTAKELAVYPQAVRIARSVIAEAFSNKVITPGVTTTNDVAWFIRERFEELQVRPWFQPYVNIQRKGDETSKDDVFIGRYNQTIQPGDILHTDVGICYFGLCTDTQEMGYVLAWGQEDVPQDLVDALAIGNTWQDNLTEQFVTGRTGNQILAAAQQKDKTMGIHSSIYTHPLGMVGHAAGPTIGMWDNQGPTPIKGDWKLYPNTAYAIEGNVKTQLSSWDNQWIQISLEQDAVFDGESVWYLAGRQTQWHVIR